MKKKIPRVFIPILILLMIPLLCAADVFLYSTTQLAIARSQGVYASPQAAMLARIEENYRGIQKATIFHAGPNFPNGKLPHVWYVSARVYADRRSDGKALGNGKSDFDFPGSYFIKMKDGWVYIPESAFPELIGRVMEALGMTGP
jgi:hypothetical protein